MINANAPVVVVEIGRNTLPNISNLEVQVSTITLASAGDCYLLVVDVAALPLVGNADILYITNDTEAFYRWDSTGEAYVAVGPGGWLTTDIRAALEGAALPSITNPFATIYNLGDYSLTSHSHSGVYAPVLTEDDNYVTDVEKASLAIERVRGTIRLTSAATEPLTPTEGDLWVDSDDSAYVLEDQNLMTVERSVKDINGIFTTLEYKRHDGSLYKRSLLTGSSPTYATRTVTLYALDGVAVISTLTYALIYNSDNDLISETVQI